jgi:hypothetical protein
MSAGLVIFNKAKDCEVVEGPETGPMLAIGAIAMGEKKRPRLYFVVTKDGPVHVVDAEHVRITDPTWIHGAWSG